MVPKWSPVYSGRMPAQIIYFNAAAQAHFGQFRAISGIFGASALLWLLGFPLKSLCPPGLPIQPVPSLRIQKWRDFPKRKSRV
jgi:hypothetical protein